MYIRKCIHLSEISHHEYINTFKASIVHFRVPVKLTPCYLVGQRIIDLLLSCPYSTLSDLINDFCNHVILLYVKVLMLASILKTQKGKVQCNFFQEKSRTPDLWDSSVGTLLSKQGIRVFFILSNGLLSLYFCNFEQRVTFSLLFFQKASRYFFSLLFCNFDFLFFVTIAILRNALLQFLVSKRVFLKQGGS